MADEPPVETPAADLAPKRRKRPPTIGDRRRTTGEASELEMIGRLGAQAQDILRLALTVEAAEEFQNFQDYLAFRDKISEFEAFCNVIESHLKEIVTDRRQELEDRFYSLWSMIFKPTLRALTKFFLRIEDEQVLPLGGKDMLVGELRALEAMRAVLSAPRFSSIADKSMLDEITTLEGVIGKLAERASSLPDFSKRPAVNGSEEEAAEEEGAPPAAAVRRPTRPGTPSQAPAPAATPPEPAPPSGGDTPNVRAVRELKSLLEYYKRDKSLRQYVDIDTRAIDEIERKLLTNAMDPAAIVWMRQICNAWASRLRDNDKDIRRVLAIIRSP